jgi:hypothetical protein
MNEFFYHEGIVKEIAALKRRFRNMENGLKYFERLCEVQFCPINPQQVVAPAKLHRIVQTDICTIWKVELIVPDSGLRPNQYPRMWFAVKGSTIAFLCIGSHIDNYDDGEMERIAMQRVVDIL